LPNRMKKRVVVEFIVLAAAMFCLRTSSFAQIPNDDPRRDTQVWNDTFLTIKLRSDLNLILFGTIRAGRDSSALVSEQAGVGMSKSFGKYFSGTVFYRYINSEPAPDRQSHEDRIYVDLTPRAPLGLGFSISDRNRVEWRNISHAVSWRYRNRLQFERPISIGERKITPYISGETQYDTRTHTLSRNQFFVGARAPLSRHVTFDGFYMRQWDARVNPGFLHVIGAYWRLEL